MKRFKIFSFISLLVVSFFCACSSGGDDAPVSVPDATTAIVLETKENQTEIKKGETLSFVVKSQDGTVLTKDIAIFVDDIKITGYSYKFEEVKEYTIYAQYKELKSSKITIKVVVSSITLEIKENRTEIGKGETLSFVVKDGEQKELKDNVLIFVDDKKIDGFSYKFEETKEYTVYAEYDGVKSAKITISVIAVTVTEEANETELFKGEKATFTVKNAIGENLTEDITLFVDNTKIEGVTYQFNDVKEYTIYAEYKGIKSPKITMKVVDTSSIPSIHTTKVLLEDYTAIWCGYCPLMAYSIEKLVEENSNVIGVALHSRDKFEMSKTQKLVNVIGIEGFPSCRLSRIIDCDLRYGENKNKVIKALDKKVNLGLSIASSLSDRDLTIKVKVHYTSKSEGDNKLVVYLIQNGLIESQSNYYNSDPDSPLYNKGNPIVNFEHNYVLRRSLSDILGDDIPNDKNKAGAIYSKVYNKSLPKYIAKNKANLEVVAFVIDKSTKKVINVQKAKVGENKVFD